MRLATYAGWLMQGVRGGPDRGAALSCCPALSVAHSRLSALYLVLGVGYHSWEGLLFGLKAAVLAGGAGGAGQGVETGTQEQPEMVTIASRWAFVRHSPSCRVPVPGHHPVGGPYRAAGPLADALGRRGGARSRTGSPAASRRGKPRTLRFDDRGVARHLARSAAAGLFAALGATHVYTLQAGFFSVIGGGQPSAAPMRVLRPGWPSSGRRSLWLVLRPDEMLTGARPGGNPRPGRVILVRAFRRAFLGGARLSGGLEPLASAAIGGRAGGAVVHLSCRASCGYSARCALMSRSCAT